MRTPLRECRGRTSRVLARRYFRWDAYTRRLRPVHTLRTVVAVDGLGRPRPKLLWRWPPASLDGPTDACPAAMHDVAARTPRGWLRCGAGVGFDRGTRCRHERGADMAGRWRCTTLRRFRRRWMVCHPGSPSALRPRNPPSEATPRAKSRLEPSTSTPRSFFWPQQPGNPD